MVRNTNDSLHQNQKIIAVDDQHNVQLHSNASGKTSFFWLGPWAKLNIVDPELIKEILRKPDVFQKPFPDIVKAVSGGLVVHEGEKWAKHRKIINPAFHLHNLKVFNQLFYLQPSKDIHPLSSFPLKLQFIYFSRIWFQQFV